MNEYVCCICFLRLDQCNTDSGRLPGVLWTLCPQPECGDADEVCTPVFLQPLCCLLVIVSDSLFLVLIAVILNASCRQSHPNLKGFTVT